MKNHSKESTKATCLEKKGGKNWRSRKLRVKCLCLQKIGRCQETVLAEVVVGQRISVSRLTELVSFLIFMPHCLKTNWMLRETLNQNGWINRRWIWTPLFRILTFGKNVIWATKSKLRSISIMRLINWLRIVSTELISHKSKNLGMRKSLSSPTMWWIQTTWTVWYTRLQITIKIHLDLCLWFQTMFLPITQLLSAQLCRILEWSNQTIPRPVLAPLPNSRQCQIVKWPRMEWRSSPKKK